MSRRSRAAVAAFGLAAAGLLLACGLRAAETPEERDRPRGRAEARTAVAAEGPARDQQRPAEQEKDKLDLGGVWLMHLPAGFEHRVTLTPVGPNRYRLEPRRLNSSGVYEVQGGRLVIVQPNDRRLLGFQWAIGSDGRLTLVGQPPRAKVGPNYLGATMVRQTR